VTTNQQSTNIDARTFDLGPVEISVATQAGPRILGYSRKHGAQLFASLPGTVLQHASAGVFRFLGGHRLWRSPEVPVSTYQPDDTPVLIAEDQAGFTVEGAADSDGVVKTLSVSQRGSYTLVGHTLENRGMSSVLVAPWAITQLVPGGTAVLPEQLESVDIDGVLPNRRLVVWPYTDLSSAEIEFAVGGVALHATDSATKTKIGLPNRRGWLAYSLGDELFVKWSPLHDDGARYPDHGASVQCYRDKRFIELETVGPLTVLDPGSSVVHREVWQLLHLVDRPLDDILASLANTPEGIEL
jgi:hypothetical protein